MNLGGIKVNYYEETPLILATFGHDPQRKKLSLPFCVLLKRFDYGAHGSQIMVKESITSSFN